MEKYLEELQRELEQLKEKRAQDLQKVDAVARQRDMFRMLLTQATGVTFPQGKFVSLVCIASGITVKIQECIRHLNRKGSCRWLNKVLWTSAVTGAGNEDLMLTSTPRRSPAVTPTTGTPTGLVATAIESTESVEAKAALKQVRDQSRLSNHGSFLPLLTLRLRASLIT